MKWLDGKLREIKINLLIMHLLVNILNSYLTPMINKMFKITSFMSLGRYQKKIGTYDKQQWEKTVEQRILNGFTNVPLKNTKLRTEFIDVDLVRGKLIESTILTNFVQKLNCFFFSSFHFRLNISESKSQTELTNRTSISFNTFPIFTIICKMVGHTNITKNILIIAILVHIANVQLGCVQLQHQSH